MKINKKTIKEFLKPDKKKIVILMIVLSLAGLLSYWLKARSPYSSPFDGNLILEVMLDLMLNPLIYIISFPQSFSYFPAIGIFSLLMSIPGIIIWYVIICLTMSSYNKLKTK